MDTYYSNPKKKIGESNRYQISTTSQPDANPIGSKLEKSVNRISLKNVNNGKIRNKNRQ